MGYKIIKLSKSTKDDVTYFKSVLVKFDEIYIQEDFAPQIVLDSVWHLHLDYNDNFYVVPTKETEEKFISREITIPFWQQCLKQRIEQSLLLQISFHLFNEKGEKFWMIEEYNEHPRGPAPVGTVVPSNFIAEKEK